MWEQYGFPFKWSNRLGIHQASNEQNWRDLLIEFILDQQKSNDVEKTKENIDNNNDHINEKDLNAPGPAVLDNSNKGEESKGL